MTHRQRQPPGSWLRAADSALIAPGAAPAERLLGYGAGVVGAAFAATLAATGDLPPLAAVVLVVIGFDLFGGAVVNATPSGSARFHGGGPRRWPAFGFVAAHIHLLVLALLLPEMPWPTAIGLYAGQLFAAALVIFVSDTYRRPIAFAAAALLIALATTVLAPTGPVLAWVAPVLVVKLLLSHLLPQPRTEGPELPGAAGTTAAG